MPTRLETDRIAWRRILAFLGSGAVIATLVVTNLTTTVLTAETAVVGGIVVAQPNHDVADQYPAVLSLYSQHLDSAPDTTVPVILDTWTMPGDIIGEDAPHGSLRITVLGYANANTDSKRVQLKVGGLSGTGMADCDFDASEVTWRLTAWAWREGSDGFRWFYECDGASANDFLGNAFATWTESEALSLDLVVTTDETPSDLHVSAWSIEWLPGPLAGVSPECPYGCEVAP